VDPVEQTQKVLETTEKAIDVYEKLTREPERPVEKSVDVILKYVSLDSEKANGKVWDNSGPPDLQIEISSSDGSYKSGVKRDQFSASINDRTVRVQEGDTLSITVYDDDVLAPDEAGSYTKAITADTMAQGTVPWSFG
jgi:hypothetical protein